MKGLTCPPCLNASVSWLSMRTFKLMIVMLNRSVRFLKEYSCFVNVCCQNPPLLRKVPSWNKCLSFEKLLKYKYIDTLWLDSVIKTFYKYCDTENKLILNNPCLLQDYLLFVNIYLIFVSVLRFLRVCYIMYSSAHRVIYAYGWFYIIVIFVLMLPVILNET